MYHEIHVGFSTNITLYLLTSATCPPLPFATIHNKFSPICVECRRQMQPSPPPRVSSLTHPSAEEAPGSPPISDRQDVRSAARYIGGLCQTEISPRLQKKSPGTGNRSLGRQREGSPGGLIV